MPRFEGASVSHSVTSDQRHLIDAYLRGEPSAVGIIDRWIDAVLQQSYRSLQREWEDLKQEVRVRLFQNLSRGVFDGRSALRTYVHRITSNVCIDVVRREHVHREVGGIGGAWPIPVEAAAGEASTECIARDLLQKVLESLTPEERLLMHRVHVEHRSYADLAAWLGVSEGAIKLRVYRCRRRMLQRRQELLKVGARRS